MYLEGTKSTEISPPEWRRKVGTLPAESQWWRDTVGEHLQEVNEDWLEMLGFDGAVMQWQVSRLSSGEHQRLALLRLLSNRPKVLLLDEPTANLDPVNAQRVEKLLGDYRTQQKSSFLWISHDTQQIQRVAVRHFVLKEGRLLER